MPVVIDGKTFYRTHEALRRIGISKATWFRWLKDNKVADVRHKDLRGWRLFTEDDITRIKKYAHTIRVLPDQQRLNFEE